MHSIKSDIAKLFDVDYHMDVRHPPRLKIRLSILRRVRSGVTYEVEHLTRDEWVEQVESVVTQALKENL